MPGRGISFSSNDRAETNSYNENLHVESDEQGLFLKSMGMQSFGRETDQKLTFEGAAELYLEMLLRPLRL